MNDKDKKAIDKIVWWIPFRKLRDFIRERFYLIHEILDNQRYILNFLNINNLNIDYIVLQMGGGFVDQLNTYRLGYSIEKLYGKKVLYDMSFYQYYSKDDIGKYNRNFELSNIFNDFLIRVATDNQVQISKLYFKTINCDNILNINLLQLINDIKIFYMDCDAIKLARVERVDFDELFDLDKYILPKLDNDNKIVYEDIKNCKYSVACHVRRNDYLVVDCRRYDLNEDYFIKAIEKISNQIKEKLKIYLFSDDMDWVKNKLVPLIKEKDKYDYMAVDINDNDRGYFDFYLISNCKYQIASEGKFCEIAHIFNKYKNKILITPNDIDEKYMRNK